MQQAGYGLGILRFYQSMQVYHITSSTEGPPGLGVTLVKL